MQTYGPSREEALALAHLVVVHLADEAAFPSKGPATRGKVAARLPRALKARPRCV